MEKIYHWKKSKNLLIYIIIITISIILGCWIEWNISGYLIIIPILTFPLVILLLIDFIKYKSIKIKLDDTTLKIKQRNINEKELKYKEIFIIYIISQEIERNKKIEIINKLWYVLAEINSIYINNIENLLHELYQKGIIICDIKVQDRRTDDIYNENTIYRWPSIPWIYNISEEPYAVTRNIRKSYRWVSEDKIQKFEKEHNLTNFTIRDKKE